MKRLIQLFPLLGLVIVFTAFTANGQSYYNSKVQIPFNFSLDDREYEAGTYVIKIARLYTGSATVTVIDPKNDRTQMVLAQQNGDESAKRIDIVFGRVGDDRTLDRIVTPDGGFAINGSRQRREASAAKRSTRTEIVGSSDLF